MEMNTITQERVAGRVLAALKEEGLMNKEAADIFGFSPTYLSSIGKTTGYHHVPMKAWTVMHDWDITGKPLREFKSPLKKEVEAEEPALQPQQTAPAPAPAPVKPPTPDQKKKQQKKMLTAAHLRSKFEAAQPKPKPEPKPEPARHQPGEETITIPRQSEKVDLGQIDMRTGALVTFEVFYNEIVIKIRR